MRHGMVETPRQARLRPGGLLPAGTIDAPPPRQAARRARADAARPILHERGKHQGPAVAFRVRPVAGGVHERAKPFVCHREGIDGERFDMDDPRRALAVLRQGACVRAHAEATASQTHDARRRRGQCAAFRHRCGPWLRRITPRPELAAGRLVRRPRVCACRPRPSS